MTKLALLAAVAAALAVPASPASAACTSTPRVAALGNNTVALCNRRVWEKQQYYVTYCLDRDLDGRWESCDEQVLIEFYG